MCLVRISARSNNIWGRKDHFVNAESLPKTLKIDNFTTIYAILMKLTSDTYLNKDFHLGKSWGVTHRV